MATILIGDYFWRLLTKNNHRMKNETSSIEQLVFEMQYRNYSSSSIKTYRELLLSVEKYFLKSIKEVTVDDLKQYLHLRITRENISVSLVNQTISAFKILQTDVLKREWNAFKIKRPRREKKLPEILSQEEIRKMISCTKNIKHKALIMLAYSSGMRRQEIQQIKPSAIDSSRMQIHVIQGKGKKDRYTILSAKALEMLRNYYKAERPKTYLFEPQGKSNKPLSATTLNDIVKNSAEKAGIKKKISFHTLRHCFATHLIEQGVNVKMIQHFMGHNSLKTTSGYISLTNLSLSKVVSPLDTMHL